MKREEALHLQSHELPAAMTQSTYDASIERDLRVLSDYHVVFLVDDLVSKVLRSTWTDAKEVTKNLASIANQYDHDGVDICFLAGETVGLRLKTTRDVEQYLETLRVDTVDYGETKLAEGLENLLGSYMDRLAKGGASVKKRNFIVILGGRDERELGDVEKVLVSVAKQLDEGRYPPDQLGVQFFQISNDGDSWEILQDFDDNLRNKYRLGRDMVDAEMCNHSELSALRLVKLLLGPINKRWDGKVLPPDEPSPL
ncbi:hypothetical protein BJ322DRAFT_54993 [Thelephora terrestris]|uniref:VWFA domain-containing protein n=1 Tax=Thelephora terrestris TaxID=56493 RepID=A0A9P6HPS3_9AGAM|nr:hypothetical protein BJ322DRAFT_54993 [Thelephora terrestris]